MCSKCGERKVLEAFEKRKEGKDGYRGTCTLCRAEKSKTYIRSIASKENSKQLQQEYYKDPTFVAKKKQQAAGSRYHRIYGITIEEYNEIMTSAVECAICGKTSGLVYDHCHTTGKFRGVLCRSCNLGLGSLGDSADMLEKAYLYLKETE